MAKNILDEPIEISDKGVTKISRLVGVFVLLIVVAFVLNNTVVQIPAGSKGVLMMFGKPTYIMDEGLNFKIPIVQSVQLMSIRTLKYEAKPSAASKDLQDVFATVALNYHLAEGETLNLYRNIGTNEMVEETIIQPAVQESVKATTAQYNAEQLITERPVVKGLIEENLKKRLGERGVLVETISITDFQFSPSFTQAIEQKQVAQQNALKAERDLERIKIEAEQIKAQAEGQANATLTKAVAEATAIGLQGKALRENQDVITLRSVEKWNGQLPLVTGSDIPFILNLQDLKAK